MPGIVFLEIDGLALPVLQRAMRDGNAPEMARWLEDGSHRLTEWETDLSSQTGASQAGHPARLQRRHPGVPLGREGDGQDDGLLVAWRLRRDRATRWAPATGCSTNDGASRGNLFSGEADAVILTVSRMSEEKRANPGYRAFLANGFNVTRMLVLFFWEVVLEWVAALRQRRRDVRPRG